MVQTLTKWRHLRFQERSFTRRVTVGAPSGEQMRTRSQPAYFCVHSRIVRRGRFWSSAAKVQKTW